MGEFCRAQADFRFFDGVADLAGRLHHVVEGFAQLRHLRFQHLLLIRAVNALQPSELLLQKDDPEVLRRKTKTCERARECSGPIRNGRFGPAYLFAPDHPLPPQMLLLFADLSFQSADGGFAPQLLCQRVLLHSLEVDNMLLTTEELLPAVTQLDIQLLVRKKKKKIAIFLFIYFFKSGGLLGNISTYPSSFRSDRTIPHLNGLLLVCEEVFHLGSFLLVAQGVVRRRFQLLLEGRILAQGLLQSTVRHEETTRFPVATRSSVDGRGNVTDLTLVFWT